MSELELSNGFKAAADDGARTITLVVDGRAVVLNESQSAALADWARGWLAYWYFTSASNGPSAE